MAWGKTTKSPLQELLAKSLELLARAHTDHVTKQAETVTRALTAAAHAHKKVKK